MKTKEELKAVREAQKRQAWIENVLRIYPKKTREEVEALWSKFFNQQSNG